MNIMMKRRKKNMNMKIMVVRKVIKVHCLMMNIYRSIIEILKQIILISYYNKLIKVLIISKLLTNLISFMEKKRKILINQKYSILLSIKKKKKNLNKIHYNVNMNLPDFYHHPIRNEYKLNQNYLVM